MVAAAVSKYSMAQHRIALLDLTAKAELLAKRWKPSTRLPN
jgi:hypothetical protein